MKIMRQRQKTMGWIEYWKKQDAADEVISRLNMDFFLQAAGNILDFDYKDVVLDIGCGYCHLAEAIQSRVSAVHCVDISDYYLERGRSRFVDTHNVYFYKLREENYTNLEILGNIRITKAVCMSVVQYYRGIEEVEQLISEVKRISMPGAKCIIADIPEGKVGYMQAISTINYVAKAGGCIAACRLILKAWSKNYRRTYRRVNLLQLGGWQLLEMTKRLDIKIEIIKDQLTINPKRMHVLIEL